MTVPIPGHHAPGAGFEAPLEMLAACHERVERQCATLQRLLVHHGQHGADEPAQAAATAVMRYFDTAARDHHADEEEDLFPALIESMAGSDAVCLRDLTHSLALEHRQLETLWQAVRVELAKIGAGATATLDGTAVATLVAQYRQHIEREDRELLPMAARLLDTTVLDRVGRAMRERRGIRAID